MNHLYPGTVDLVVRQQPSDTYERGKCITVKQQYNIYIIKTIIKTIIRPMKTASKTWNWSRQRFCGAREPFSKVSRAPPDRY